MRTTAAVLGLLTFASLTACGGDGQTTPADPTGRTFVSTSVEGDPIPGGGPLVLGFTDPGRLSVAAGCNQGSADVNLADGKLVAGPLAMTLMACPGEAAGADAWAAGLLDAQPNWTLDGDTLTLTDGHRFGDADGREGGPAGRPRRRDHLDGDGADQPRCGHDDRGAGADCTSVADRPGRFRVRLHRLQPDDRVRGRAAKFDHLRALGHHPDGLSPGCHRGRACGSRSVDRRDELQRPFGHDAGDQRRRVRVDAAGELAGVSPLSRAWVAFVLASRDFGVVGVYYLTVARSSGGGVAVDAEQPGQLFGGVALSVSIRWARGRPLLPSW